MTGSGFQGFVAWRYLMARPRKVSRVALITAGVFAVVSVACALLMVLVFPPPDPRTFAPKPDTDIPLILGIVSLVALGLVFVAAFVGTLRYFFTFFTTVPVFGVWVGTLALTVVLSVMSGFESDLQEKILGSNAHIQIIKADGPDETSVPFVEWDEVKKKVDGVPGVEASMPFVTSEAVISANNNYSTVIIKGIDPDQVQKVTKLHEAVVAAFESEHVSHDEAVKVADKSFRALRPLIVDDPPMPDVLPPSGGGDVVDPAPPDMPGGAEPVDYSAGAAGIVDPVPDDFADPDGEPTPQDFSKPRPDRNAPVAAPGDLEPPSDLTDDVALDASPAVDGGAPLDASPLVDGGAPRDAGAGGTTHVLTVPLDGDSDFTTDDESFQRARDIEGRTARLPGILVGKELDKTIHVQTGDEVRVVSPLSDPSNPDATGTPIPFNRDFRVAGVFFSGMYEYDLKYVYVPLDALQDFLDLGDAVDGIEVRVTDPDATADVGAAITAAIGPGYEVRDWQELNRNLFSALKLEKIAMFLVLAIVILVASFAIIGNLIMVVVEKQKEIALLKTLGASDAGVLFLFVMQGLFIGMVGTGLGVGMGLILCVYGQQHGIPLNPDVYYIDRLPIHIDPQSVIAAAITGVLISIGATLYPALLAARVRPAIGMRH